MAQASLSTGSRSHFLRSAATRNLSGSFGMSTFDSGRHYPIAATRGTSPCDTL